jgi:hypothetical protein
MNNQGLAKGKTTKLVYNIAFHPKSIDPFPLAVGDYYYQAIVGHTADHSLQKPEFFIFSWDDDCHPVLEMPNRFLIYLSYSYGAMGTWSSFHP